MSFPAPTPVPTGTIPAPPPAPTAPAATPTNPATPTPASAGASIGGGPAHPPTQSTASTNPIRRQAWFWLLVVGGILVSLKVWLTVYLVNKQPDINGVEQRGQQVKMSKPSYQTVIVAPVGGKSAVVEQNYVPAEIWSTSPVKVWNVNPDGMEALVTDRNGDPIIITADNPNVKLGTPPWACRFEAVKETAHVTVVLRR